MIKITRAGPEDIEPLKVLLRQQFNEHTIPGDSDTLKSAILPMLEGETLGFFLVARERDRILGFAAVSFAWTLEHGGKSAWLDELYVIPDRRGEGIGGQLMDQVAKEAVQCGCRAIDLEVDQDHQEAQRLYLRKGFKQLPRTRWVKNRL